MSARVDLAGVSAALSIEATMKKTKTQWAKEDRLVRKDAAPVEMRVDGVPLYAFADTLPRAEYEALYHPRNATPPTTKPRRKRQSVLDDQDQLRAMEDARDFGV